MVFVLDSTALHALPDACGGAAQCGACLDDLATMIAGHDACFCRESIAALKQLAPDGVHYAWAHAAAAAMWTPAVNWQQRQEVVFVLEDHMDMELLDDEPELTSVLAVANVLSEDMDVTVVTEDDIDKIDCVSMTSGAQLLGLPAVDLAEFGAVSGLDQHFV